MRLTLKIVSFMLNAFWANVYHAGNEINFSKTDNAVAMMLPYCASLRALFLYRHKRGRR